MQLFVGYIDDLISIDLIINDVNEKQNGNKITRYEVIGLTKTTIRVQLHFEFPEEISRED